MSEAPVLIAGAGPTGLLLALSLARRGVRPRIVDMKEAPTDTSRAIAVQARTLELYDQLGIADDVLAKGIPVEHIDLLQPGGGERLVALGKVGEGISPFPNVLCYPQDDHERMLVAKLAQAGVAIDWRTEVDKVRPTSDGVEVTLKHAGGAVEVVHAAYVCGCDGVHSRVRESMGVDFPGGTYERRYFVADARVTGASPRDIRVSVDGKILGLCFPVRPDAVRLIGIVPSELADRSDVAFEDVRPDVETLLRVHVDRVHWFSLFRVHHRVARTFRVGPCFLAGDAGHVHSPVGGQGMNTGIGDAFNLSWKLAAVLGRRASPRILDTYDPERTAFARSLVSTTDAIFQGLVSRGWTGWIVRQLMPRVMARVLAVDAARRTLFRRISQVRIEYHDSALSEGAAGRVKAGDRLPWLGGARGGPRDNFAALRSNDWQLHFYGEPAQGIVQTAVALALPVHAFAWDADARRAGFRRDAAYLVRPDGHVALALVTPDATRLRRYAERFDLRFEDGR